MPDETADLKCSELFPIFEKALIKEMMRKVNNYKWISKTVIGIFIYPLIVFILMTSPNNVATYVAGIIIFTTVPIMLYLIARSNYNEMVKFLEYLKEGNAEAIEDMSQSLSFIISTTKLYVYLRYGMFEQAYNYTKSWDYKFNVKRNGVSKDFRNVLDKIERALEKCIQK